MLTSRCYDDFRYQKPAHVLLCVVVFLFIVLDSSPVTVTRLGMHRHGKEPRRLAPLGLDEIPDPQGHVQISNTICETCRLPNIFARRNANKFKAGLCNGENLARPWQATNHMTTTSVGFQLRRRSLAATHA
jgi:hypothetical protein